MKHATDTDHPLPAQVEHTYGCHMCQDTGFHTFEEMSRLGYPVVKSEYCPHCEYGKARARMLAGHIVERKAKGETPNRKLYYRDGGEG